jgi:hypothetical protein
MLAVFHAWEYLTLCRTIAFELIRDDHTRDIVQALEQLLEKRLRRLLVTPALHQDVEHVPLLIHRPPQIVALLVWSRVLKTSAWLSNVPAPRASLPVSM